MTASYDRKGFLGRLGAGALAAGGLSGAGAAAAAAADDPGLGGFGRMFTLPPFAEATPQLEQALLELGKPGGLMDAKDNITTSPEGLFLPENSHYDEVPSQLAAEPNNPTNPVSTAGSTFVAQFMAHDITFDATSTLGRATPPERGFNARSAVFDLESVYGGGPTLAPQLYERDGATLRVESGGRFEDVPRGANGTPLIGDPRNDQTTVISGLHAAFLLFHNRALERVRDFETARRETRWHYQWLIVNEFLPEFVGRDLVANVLKKGRRFYNPRGRPFIPVEFQAAAFRFGHSMVRPSYRLNFSGNAGQPFFGLVFDPNQDSKPDPNDMRGGVRSPRRFVDWQTFFDFEDGWMRPSKRIDTKISTPLFNLPLGAIPVREPPKSLPQRDLLRNVTWQLPSGQAIAKQMKVPALTRYDLRELAQFGLGLDKSTPLFFYVLKEAAVVQEGLRLGPVGGRIVAEVILGLLQLDAKSYLKVNPKWKPTFAQGGEFRMTDFLAFAGVDPKSRAA